MAENDNPTGSEPSPELGVDGGAASAHLHFPRPPRIEPINPLEMPRAITPAMRASVEVVEISPGLAQNLSNLTAAFSAGMRMLSVPAEAQMASMIQMASAVRSARIVRSAHSADQAAALAERMIDVLDGQLNNRVLPNELSDPVKKCSC